MKSHLDDDSCLPICKTIPAICDTPRQTHFVGNSIFPHFVMVMTLLWAKLWSVVARCNLANNVRYLGFLQSNILIAYAACSTVLQDDTQVLNNIKMS